MSYLEYIIISSSRPRNNVYNIFHFHDSFQIRTVVRHPIQSDYTIHTAKIYEMYHFQMLTLQCSKIYIL